MKGLILLVAGLLSSVAFAGQRDWQAELAQYQESLKTTPTWQLYVLNPYWVGSAFTSCGASPFIIAAAFAADTFPGLNPAAEYIAHATDPDYKSYQDLMTWETAASLVRGAMGGGSVALTDTLKFVLQYFAGNPEPGYQDFQKVYASTFATAQALFGSQGECMMSLSKVILIEKEASTRKILPLEQTHINPLR
jgi:hypothetical protein